MTLNISIPQQLLKRIGRWSAKQSLVLWCTGIAALTSIAATAYVFSINGIIAYGDAESHLNIAKRVVSGLTPGLAQLGGIWLPLPHLLMAPFVFFDPLWRTGLGGSLISGICFCISAIIVFKLVKFLTQNSLAAFVGFIVFIANPNVLYMQSTPMTEMPLIAFLLLSTYFFIIYLSRGKIYPLMLAAAFGLAASISRYDGWFLVLLEGLFILIYRFPYRRFWQNIKKRGLTLFAFLTEQGEGEAILFATVALSGILAWFIWGYLILGDPLYFTNSQFSAKSQQQGFLGRGELPAYHNLPLSFLYYAVTSMATSGVFVFGAAVAGALLFLRDKNISHRFYYFLLILSPFLFNILTLFLGQSIIFIPHLTPVDFEWRLFNVRYGLLMMPAIAVLFGYLFSRLKQFGKTTLIVLLVLNLMLYLVGYARVMSYDDGTIGLSHSSHPDAEQWLAHHYDGGLMLLDDYSRTLSVIGSSVPMQKVIYVGSHLYWDEALKAPQRRVRWVVMQNGDEVWKHLYDDPRMQGILYTYFQKVYTSDTILIFRRME
jgi:hypothetical protein